jgi:hypothetical protein
MKRTVHAGKIPDAAQRMSTLERKVRGVEMENACDGKPWSAVPIGLPSSQVSRCPLCVYLVEQDRSNKGAS